MRWRFIDKDNRAEVTEREILIRKIDAWWRGSQHEPMTWFQRLREAVATSRKDPQSLMDSVLYK